MTFLLIVTLSSMILAGIMSIVAWRSAALERRRSEARIAALAAEIHAPSAAAASAAAASASGGRRTEIGLRAEPQRIASFPSLRSAPRWDDDLPIRPAADQASQTPDLFTVARPQSGSRLGVIVAVGGLVVAGALALTIALGRGLPADPAGVAPAAEPVPAAKQPSSAVTAGSAAAGSAAAPLELVALGHDRDGDRLTVRGVVRNPASGASVQRLVAAILAFDSEGGFLGTGRAIIEAPVLAPGAESTFVVSVPGTARVSRYRVSFRSGDRLVPHVDAREPTKISP
jgi:hypothetical protein